MRRALAQEALVSAKEFIDIVVEDHIEVKGFLDDGNERLRDTPTGPGQPGGSRRSTATSLSP